jgi:uncharacterized protein (TIGR02246 family)
MTSTMTEVEQIRDVLGAYERALNASDAVAAAAVYAPDARFFPSNQATATGPAIRRAYEAIFDSLRLSIAFDLHEVVVDGDLAYATTGSEGTVTKLASNDTVSEASRELFVFARADGDWKIARYMFNKSAQTTTAVVATAVGGPEALSVTDIPIREPGPGEVRLHVHAVGTNPVDYKLYSGSFGPDPTLPMRLGLEAAGVVTAVGDGAEGPAGPVRVGDEVIAFPIEVGGSYAADLILPGSSIVPKPSALSFEQASGLMLTGTTAVHALQAAGVGAGDTVVIHGASGGVGLMAVQLAVAAGARVIATASESRHAYLRSLGAEPVAYGDGLLERIRALAPGGVDAAVDAVGTDEAIDTSLALVAQRDRIATVAGFQRGFELGLKVLGRVPGADPGTEIRDAARLELIRQVEAGTLRVLVAATHPLADAAAAHRELATGHTHGKIVLVP